MSKKAPSIRRRRESLSRDRIIQAAIELLDSGGEDGLTFRALAERLATGPGAIYWHMADKSDLVTGACDTLIARTVQDCVGATPEATIRVLALGMFDAMSAHPWLGAALASPAGQLPIVRILEPLGQQVCALGIPEDTRWAAVSALVSYILGVGGQNAANGQLARTRGLDRSEFLDAVATMWSQLNAREYPFTRSLAVRLRTHDDRLDFLTGIDLILRGIESTRGS
ncbi:MAG TPA: TetR family transcriptional regulator [Bryobacteraceae bacterium]|nr:TetR family transcriptional regulator [Bryobacteraceae bacterium]